ncbi:MAG TPA: hypothetical protein VFO69_08125 [Allosphingosinicella sp.]|nr:hypothetical protein [Allosphingosinicella sp.]
MDSMRGFQDEAFSHGHSEEEPAMERPPEIGLDERRMHVRAYNYWVSLLEGRPYPSIHDLDPGNIEDFGSHSVLLDFTADRDDPQLAFLGRSLRGECELEDNFPRHISEVPGRSLLSRLTDHYMQIMANRAPIGFEAEYLNRRGLNTLYRGILMPFSSDGDSIDYIYGVINWKELAGNEITVDLADEVDRAIASAPAPPADWPVWADGPHAALEDKPADAQPETVEANLNFWPSEETPEAVALPADAGLADRLCMARDWAGRAHDSNKRSRSALYAALGHAYDFALAAEGEPDDYADLLEDCGLKVQARSPMTPVVKLVFGADYDKTRLTEFAAALSWAKRENVPAGTLAEQLEAQPGGLKGVVQAERAFRRPAPRPDRVEEIRDRLRSLPAFANVEIEVGGEDEFVLLVARREAGGLAIVAPVADARLTEQAIRKSAA